jgi:hypothetical protein
MVKAKTICLLAMLIALGLCIVNVKADDSLDVGGMPETSGNYGKTYTITYIKSDETVYVQPVKEGNPVGILYYPKLENEERYYEKFEKWEILDEEGNALTCDGAVVSLTEDFVPDHDITVVAVVYTVRKYKVTFVDKGIEMYTDFVAQEDIPKHEEPDFLYYGYYHRNSDGSALILSPLSFLGGFVYEDMDLAPIYKSDSAPTYCVYFDAVQGKFSDNTNKKEVKYTASINLDTQEEPTLKRHIFMGWIRNIRGKKEVVSQIDSETVKLYASWQRVTVESTSIDTLKRKKNKLIVTVQNVNDGVQIKYATNKKFKKSKVVDSDRLRTKIKIKSKKRLYVKVRGYNIDSTGAKVYGKWSVRKSIF